MWASDDSTHIAYLTSTTSDASQSSLYGANADGTGATLLLANIDTNASFSGQHPACFPRARLPGRLSGRLVVHRDRRRGHADDPVLLDLGRLGAGGRHSGLGALAHLRDTRSLPVHVLVRGRPGRRSHRGRVDRERRRGPAGLPVRRRAERRTRSKLRPGLGVLVHRLAHHPVVALLQQRRGGAPAGVREQPGAAGPRRRWRELPQRAVERRQVDARVEHAKQQRLLLGREPGLDPDPRSARPRGDVDPVRFSARHPERMGVRRPSRLHGRQRVRAGDHEHDPEQRRRRGSAPCDRCR